MTKRSTWIFVLTAITLGFAGCSDDPPAPAEEPPMSSLEKRLGVTLKPVANQPRWLVVDASFTDYQQAEQATLALHDRVTEADIQIVCGMVDDEWTPRIYVLTGTSPIDVIEAFAVGTHNAYPSGKAVTKRVVGQMQRIYEIAPFRPYMADAAGYKCRFIDGADMPTCVAIESILLDGVGAERYENETEGDEPPGEIFAPTIHREQAITLWWD